MLHVSLDRLRLPDLERLLDDRRFIERCDLQHVPLRQESNTVSKRAATHIRIWIVSEDTLSLMVLPPFPQPYEIIGPPSNEPHQ
jgi:hypothetical protein